MSPAIKAWVADVVVGGLTGLVIGAIVAVNVVIASGVEGGYEASIGDVFDHSPVMGVIVIAIVLAGPAAGVTVARRIRRRREAG